MAKAAPLFGLKALKERVLDPGLCTHCGACVNLCPYAVAYKDRTILLDDCNREEGRCYAFCPRTPADLQSLREQFFDPQDMTPELGPMKGFFLVRAADPQIRRDGQHGGTVTALLSFALETGKIDLAVIAGQSPDLLPFGIVAQTPREIRNGAKSKFVAAPTLATLNKVLKESPQRVGIVATPCQALALAKMRAKPLPSPDRNIDQVKLIIGLFCGWALSWSALAKWMEAKFGNTPILGLDIPPSQHHSMEVHTPGGIVPIDLGEVLPMVRPACRYCPDMTAEFADLSIGSARLPEGWEAARGWNQVIVRSDRGAALMDSARKQGVLEFRHVPEGNLDRLKRASLQKKRNALKNLAQKSGKARDFIYLDPRDPLLQLAMGE